MNLSSITQVTNDKLRDSAALSVIGRSANSTGDPADIAAATDGHVLRRSGTTLGFGQITAAGIAKDAVTSDKIDDLAVTTGKLATATQQLLVPAGAVMAFARSSAPSGWLVANGSAVSRTTYATLFSAISTKFGTGDGSTTFNLPDLRSIFVRGSTSQTISGEVYNKTFGTKEAHALENITGKINLSTNAGLSASFSGAFYSSEGNTSTQVRFGDGSVAGDYSFDASRVVNTSSETRPASIALNYCIKI